MSNKTEITAEPGKQELFITREFDAPRELVFKANVDPDIYVKWCGPRDLTLTIHKWEPRLGGSYNLFLATASASLSRLSKRLLVRSRT